jgi:hypothetical protein
MKNPPSSPIEIFQALNVLVKIDSLKICVSGSKIIDSKSLTNFREISSRPTAFDFTEQIACFTHWVSHPVRRLLEQCPYKF